MADYICSPFGGLAQLARALAWHARGRRFDPDTLHKNISHSRGIFCLLCILFILYILLPGTNIILVVVPI